MVLLSGYASALYDEELYPDWWRVERSVHRPSANRAGRGRQPGDRGHLWSNRPLPTQLELGWPADAPSTENCEPEAGRVARIEQEAKVRPRCWEADGDGGHLRDRGDPTATWTDVER